MEPAEGHDMALEAEALHSAPEPPDAHLAPDALVAAAKVPQQVCDVVLRGMAGRSRMVADCFNKGLAFVEECSSVLKEDRPGGSFNSYTG